MPRKERIKWTSTFLQAIQKLEGALEKIDGELTDLLEKDKKLTSDSDELGAKIEEIEQEHLVAATEASKAMVRLIYD